MKSDSKGIYSKLKDPSVSWNEKLSLAKSAWDSSDCVIPNKQQVLLDWIVQELINGNKKAAISQISEDSCCLWKLLLHVLQSQQLVFQARVPVVLKPQLLQVFTDTFLPKEPDSREGSMDVVISCCYKVVSSPQLASSLLAKSETYVSFLSSLLSFFVPICLEQSKELHLLVEECLEKYLLVQRQQANQRKVFTAMCQQLLEPLISLRQMLKLAKHRGQFGDWLRKKAQDISQLVELALTNSLFHKDHLSEYQQALKVARERKQTDSGEPASKKPKITTYTKLLFDKLWEMASHSVTAVNVSGAGKVATQEGVLEILPFLYKEFIICSRKANSSPSAMEFDFFAEVCEMMGFLNGTWEDISSVCTLLHQLLECILLHDIYQVADDSSSGSLQFNWFKNLVEVLIHAERSGDAVFQCLDDLMKLNHSLLEPHLEQIWIMLWKGGDNAGAVQDSLISSFISTYVKLRQFEKLVLAILVSLRSLELSTFGLPATFKQRFTTAIQRLPFGQIASIWNIFCEEIQENYLNKLLSKNEHVLVKKAHKKKSLSGVVALWRNLEYVMSIFSAFLLNVSFGGIGEQLTRKSSVLSARKLLHHTAKVVLEPLIGMAYGDGQQTGKERESACFCTLLLHYALGELEVFLNKIKRVEEDDERGELPSVVWNDQIADFVPARAEKVTIISRDRGRLWYIKNALCIQSIRSTLLKKTELNQEPEVCDELQQLVSCVCSSVSEQLLLSAPWDRQVFDEASELTINEENAPVALWDLISRNAVVLLPLCSADQQLTLAQLLVKTIAQEKQEIRQDHQGFITMSDVSMAIIQSAAFHEMSAMQTCTVCALWGQLKESHGSPCNTDSLGGMLSKALNDIASLQPPTVGGYGEAGIWKDCAQGDDHIDSEEEGDGIDEDQNSERSSVEDSDGEEDFEKDKETSDEQAEGGLNAFYALGCELTGISRSVLSSDTPVGNFSAAECHRILKVLGYLPLDWLSDDNHARCLIGLFTCDVLFNSALFKECSPDLLKPLLLSRQLLTAMFDGCVSRKRFITHHVIDLESLHAWLVGSSTTLWQKFHMEPNTASGMRAMFSITRGLVYVTVKYLLKTPANATCTGQRIVQKLQEDLQAISIELQQCSKHSLKKTVSSFHAISITVEGFLAACEEVLVSKISSGRMIRLSSDIVIKLGPALLEQLRTIVQASHREGKGKKESNAGEGSESKWHWTLLQFPILIDSFTSLLHIYSASEQSRKLLNVNEELKQCEWQDVFDVILTGVSRHVFDERSLPPLENEVGTLHSCLHLLTTVCQSCSTLELHLPDNFHIRLLASALHFLKSLELNKNNSTGARESDHAQSEQENYGTQNEILETIAMYKGKGSKSGGIAEEGYSLVVSLIEGCDPVLLPELLEGLCDEITSRTTGKESMGRVCVSLHVWLRLLSGRFTKERKKELRPKLPKVLFALQVLLQEFKTVNPKIVRLAIDVMVKILSLGKGMVLPHNALLVLHSGLTVKLTIRDNSLVRSFPQLFESQYSLLSTLLFQHSEAVYGAVHVFVTCVRNLLVSLAEQSDSLAVTFKPTELLKCAQRMARLYQEIASHKSTFSKYSPYMIADYIQCVQSLAIPSVIRDALIPGVYCLLDMCGEHELSLMHAVLEKGSRELFLSLHADYSKYHKFKGKV